MSVSALYSKYVIDGVQQDFVPAEILSGCAQCAFESDGVAHEPIIDESLETSLDVLEADPSQMNSYLARIAGAKHKMSLPYCEVFTKQRLALALLETLWKKGTFALEDLAVDARWQWADLGIGSMAAFYKSVTSAADYLDGLFIRLHSYKFDSTRSECSVSFKVSSEKRISSSRAVSASLKSDSSSWIIYIPFDNCQYRLGGSLLRQELGGNAGAMPQIGDADYFIDCFEVVRELVEDGILLSAASVCDGGLLNALKHMSGAKTGAHIDISDVMRYFDETNPVRILFGEVPGVIIQIRDIDFDYIDAEMLLQDVAFFPLGHPTRDGDIKVCTGAKSGIQNILESLMHSQGSEGED